MNVFIVRPFEKNQGIDFDLVEEVLIQPALARVGIHGSTTAEIFNAGKLRHNMSELLLTADLVIADISLPDANLFYQLGIRHALRDKPTILIGDSGIEVPFDLKTDRYLSYDKTHPATCLAKLTQAFTDLLASDEKDRPVFPSRPEFAEQDQGRFNLLPRDFVDEVQSAKTGDCRGDLELLAEEVRGFSWELEGLRLIGRAQFQLQAYEGARRSWERVRESYPDDLEANLLLGTIDRRLSDRPKAQQASPHVLLFTGHMIDQPDRTQPRFPPDQESIARREIEKHVAAELARVGGPITGMAGGACGGDILFHEVCAELGIPSKIYLALPTEQYLVTSVQHGGAQWVDRFNALNQRLESRVLSTTKELPNWLQEKAKYSIWQRNNLWTLFNALAVGGSHLTLIALWDGQRGDGAGGTEDMVEQSQARGAKTIIIDTKRLFSR